MRILQVSDLTIRFGGLVAVNGLNLGIDQGEIVGLIGPNGAGKTTVFNLLTGVYQPTSGDIQFKGKSIVNLKPNEIVRRGIARTFQNIRLFPSLTVLENVLTGHLCRIREGVLGALILSRGIKMDRARAIRRVEEVLEVVGLEDKMEELATSLPYGQQRLVEIARALATEPELLLLDEPAAGMNPQEKIQLMKLVRRISSDLRKTILIIEHDMKVIMDISRRIAVLDYGEKIVEGSPKEVREDRRVIEAYLGGGNVA